MPQVSIDNSSVNWRLMCWLMTQVLIDDSSVDIETSMQKDFSQKQVFSAQIFDLKNGKKGTFLKGVRI